METTHGGGVDPSAVIGHPPEDRNWRPEHGCFKPIVRPSARIEAFATVDSGTKRQTTVSERVWLLKHCHIGHDALIGVGAELATGTIVGGWCEIGENVKCGIGVTILPFRKVGDGATIGAGAVVVKDVPPGATVVGNPARILRDEERDPRPHSDRNPFNVNTDLRTPTGTIDEMNATTVRREPPEGSAWRASLLAEQRTPSPMVEQVADWMTDTAQDRREKLERLRADFTRPIEAVPQSVFLPESGWVSRRMARSILTGGRSRRRWFSWGR